MSITEIIRQGLANGDSYEVINKRLADGGFNLKLVPSKDTGWTDLEMKEGFKEGEPAKDAVHLADLMHRNIKLAGTSPEFWCVEGKFRVRYDENGYAKEATRVNV